MTFLTSLPGEFNREVIKQLYYLGNQPKQVACALGVPEEIVADAELTCMELLRKTRPNATRQMLERWQSQN